MISPPPRAALRRYSSHLCQGVHTFLTLLFLMNGHWLALVLNIPLVAWNVNKYHPRRPFNINGTPQGIKWTAYA